MKGVVFTEFLDFVGNRYGEDAVDDLIAACDLPSGGAYTTVGTYAHAEMTALCGALAAQTGEPAADLVHDFGLRLSQSFVRDHPSFYSRADNLFDFLESIEDHIHVEVLKLYPDAELPSFTVQERTATRLVMVYRSPRRMGVLATGLIEGSAHKFGVEVRVNAVAMDSDAGEATRFDIDLL